MESSIFFFVAQSDSLHGPLSEVKRSGEVFKELRKAAAAEMVISREVEGNGGKIMWQKGDGIFQKNIYPIGELTYSHQLEKEHPLQRAIGMGTCIFSKGIYSVVGYYFAVLQVPRS